MARGHSQSIGCSDEDRQSGPNRQLRRWLAVELRRPRPSIEVSAARCKADRYRKHFRSYAHACLLIFHGLSGKRSLRESFGAFGVCRGLAVISGLASSQDPDDERLGVSFSEFADSNTTRRAAFLGGVVPSLIARVREAGRLRESSLPEELHLLDSTFLRLSLALAPWLPGHGASDVPGVRLQVQYAPALDLPEHVLITDTRTNDCQGLDQAILDNPHQLEQLQGQTLVVDLGYYSHARFARLLAACVHFVSRLNTQARVQVEADLPVQQSLPGLEGHRINVLSDQRITLGSANNQAGAVLPALRLVTANVEPLPKAARSGAKPVVYRVLTDRWNLNSAEVVKLYLWRWQIELFFRWLKSHIHLPRLLGYSRNAVELTLWLALIVHLLSVLAARAQGLTRRSPSLLSRLALAISHLTPSDLYKPATLSLTQLPLNIDACFPDPPT